MVEEFENHQEMERNILFSTHMEDDNGKLHLLSLKDFKGFTLKEGATEFNKLALVASVGMEKLERRERLRLLQEKKTLKASVSALREGDTKEKKKKKKKKRSRDVVIETKNKKPPRKRPRKSTPIMSRGIPPYLKTLIRIMEGEEILPLFEKLLTPSDVKKGQNRLLMPEKGLVSQHFLNEKEKSYLKPKTNKKIVDIKVTIFEPETPVGKEISLRMWDMKKQSGIKTVNYVLTTEWYYLVKRNGLKVGDVIQVWSFRVRGVLHLALVILKRKNDI